MIIQGREEKYRCDILENELALLFKVCFLGLRVA